MSQLTHLYTGACTLLLVSFGVLCTPSTVLAAPGEPPEGHGAKSCHTIHQIALGENLTWIAAQYGVSVEQLVEENGIEDANLIVENQALCIPEKSRGSLNEWATYGVPGQSYDPSYVNRQENSYGPQENGYGREENGYDPQENGNGRYDAEPNHSYDPSQYNTPGKAGESSVKPESSKPETYWKDEKRYPQGGAFFPEYVPSSDEEEPEPDPVPEPDPGPNGDNGNNVGTP